jgi:hypothetical protein
MEAILLEDTTLENNLATACHLNCAGLVVLVSKTPHNTHRVDINIGPYHNAKTSTFCVIVYNAHMWFFIRIFFPPSASD